MASLSFRGAPRVKLLCALVASCFAAEFAHANPTGPSVAAGAAAFNTVGKTLTVTNSPNAIINWQGFSIGAGEATRFQQQGASSAVLNRVVGQDPSAILGTLWSNGKVFLINPNGVLFGQGSRIDVAGLVASTLNLTDRDFLAGRLNFQAGTVAGSIVNQGEITSASGGRIFLIAPDVQNHGLISSPSGEVVLAAGKSVSLVDADVPNLKVEVQAGGEALNVGRILADGGKAGIYAGLITQRGIVRADSVSKDATGKIVFKASDTTILDEGSVTSAAGAKGGEIQVLGNKVGLVGTARVDASGDTGGGTVLIGGDYQGKNPEVQNAARTYVGPDATIKADARAAGDGGKVVVWSDEVTGFYGNISARGGTDGGNGGFAEVSSKGYLDFSGRANLLAPRGKVGTLLLDPSNVTISDAIDSLFSGGFLTGVFSGATSALTNIQWLTIDAQLLLGNVVVTTSGSGGSGNITVAASHTLLTPNTFSLLAHNDIAINGAITTAFGGSLAMYAGWDGASTSSPAVNGGGIGSINVNQNLNAPNGSIVLTASKDILITSAQVSGSNTQLSAAKGDLTLTNATVAGYPLALSAPVGTITVDNSRVDGGGSGGAVSMNAADISILNSNGSNGVYAGGPEGSGTITMTSTNGITVNNSAIAADAGSSQNANITLTATGGMITVTGASTIIATSSVDATVTLNGAAGVTVNGNSFVQSFASNNASVSLLAGNPGAAITVDSSEVTAKPSSGNNFASVSMNAAGPLTLTGATVEAYSNLTADVSLTAGGNLTINAGPSPTVEVRGGGAGNSTANLVSGANVVIGGDILSDTGSGTASINISATSGAITSTGGILTVASGGPQLINLSARDGIGTIANPIRIQDEAPDIAAMNSSTTTGDIAISVVNGGLNFDGDLNNLLNSNPGGTYFLRAESGDINLSIPFKPNGADLLAGQSVFFKAPAGNIMFAPTGTLLPTGTGNVTLEAGNHLSLTGAGTQVSGNNVSFFANDMDLSLGGAIVATTSATLAPFDLTTNMAISANPLPCGLLCLSPTEIQKVSAPVLTVGRSDSTTNILYLQDPLNTAHYSVAPGTGLLRLHAGFIYENAGGGIGGPFNHSLELRAGGGINLTVNSINLADNNNLSILAGQDFAGDLNIGGVTLQVGTTAANTGSMTIQAGNSGLGTMGNINAVVSGGGATAIRVAGTGAQNITTTNDFTLQNSNVTTGNMFVQAVGGPQTINVGNQLFMLGGTGTGTNVTVQAGGAQSITVGGSLIIRGGDAGTGNSARITGGGNQTVTANYVQIDGGVAGGGFGTGNPGAIDASGSQTINVGSGGLSMTAGGGEDNAAQINQFGLAGTTQTINMSGPGGIVLQGGSSAATPSTSPHGARAQITASGDLQTIAFSSAGAISLQGGTVGSRNYALILNDNAQTISGSPSITLTGGASGGTAGNGNFARISSNNGNQNISASSITLNGGAGGEENLAQIGQFGLTGSQTIAVTGFISAAGGSGGINNFARIRSQGVAQTISAAGITLTGGAAGGADGAGNFAQIVTDTGSQDITAGSGGLHLTAGAAGITNFASIEAPFQDISVLGDLSLTGGGSNPGTTGAGARVGGRGGASPTPTDLVLTVGGDVTLIGGSVAGATGSAIGSASLATPQRTDISMTVGGNVTLISGSASGTRIGSSGASASDGDISLTVGGNVAVNGGNSIRTLGALTINAAGAMVLSGSNSGSGQSAVVFSGGNETITANSITLNGGDAGGADLSGNFAQISSNGVQTVTTTAGDLTLNAGSAGINNYASITAPTQIVTVHGNLSLTGGGSATSLDGTIGGGARIGGPGGASPAPTNLSLAVDGSVHLTGGTVANAGSAIGSGNLGGQATAITMTAGGNVTLNPGTVANAGSRIGSPASGMAGGDIAVTAGGALALNSTGPGLGTAIRTLGNVTLNAASITQGADSVIIAGGTTTIGGGTVSLPSATNQFGTVLLATTGNVLITDADAINFGTSTTGSGSLTVTAPGGITQSGPITSGAATFHAGASPIVLTNAGNDFTGPVDLDTSSSASITDANALIIQGGGGGGSSPTSLTINANGAVTQSAGFTGTAPAVIVINAGSGPITLNSTGNNFTGNTSMAANTTGAVSLTNGNAGGINLAASTVGGALSLTSGGPVTQSGPITVAGASTINAGSNAITLTNGSNDFAGTVNFTGSNVSITDVNAIAIGNSNASGALNIVATSTSFLNGLNATNYSFSGGTYALAAGTYNLGGTTTVAQSPGTGAPTVVDLATGATINTAGGTVTVGVGGTLSGTGTIQGNVNNLAGTVSPGASPGMLTITGNYTQGASGVLDMQIGGLVAGTDYDQLRVGGTTSLAGTLNTALINGFVPPTGSTFTLVQSTGAVSGTFTTTNQPAGTLFNSFYGPTTVDFVTASSGGSVPPQLVPVVQNTIVSVEQVLVALAPTTTTTNSETGLLLVPGIDVAPATEARDEGKAAAGSDKKEEKSVAKKTFCN